MNQNPSDPQPGGMIRKEKRSEKTQNKQKNMKNDLHLNSIFQEIEKQATAIHAL